MALTWRAADSRPIYISTASGTLTISIGGESNVSFDGAGRLLGAWLGGVTYRRSLDNRLLAKWPDQAGQRARKLLPLDERRAPIEAAYTIAARLFDQLEQGCIDTGATSLDQSGGVRACLTQIRSWDWAALEADAARFHTVYKPVSILPPDQYLALVLQATEGCSYNRCTFCTFYRDRPFRIKSPQEFAAHCDAVIDFMGASLGVRRSIFLADANAVIIPQDRLLPLLDVLHSRFTVGNSSPNQLGRFNGIYAFISAPDALHKQAEDFAELRQRGVSRLYVGLETGYDPLRRFIAKPGCADDVAAAVNAIKAGGIAVGLIVLVGVGGVPFRQAHFAATQALIRRLPLGPGDLIYLSPFVDEAAAPYLDAMRAAGYAALSDDEIRAERAAFKQALRPWAADHGVQISHYDVREFIY